MRYWMRARATRAVAMLFGLSLLVAACDMGDVNELVADLLGGTPAAAAGDDAAPEGDDAGSEDAESEDDGAGSDDGGAVADEGSGSGADDQADRRRCINRNEHVANLRAAAESDEAPAFRQERRQRDDQQAADAPEPQDQDQDQEQEAPRERRDGGGDRDGQSGDGGASEGDGGQSSGLSGIEQDVFDLLNAERQRAGLAPLELDDSLSQGARQWSRRMATEDFFEHDTSGNFAENIAFGYPDAAAVHGGWMDSEGHRRNRMNAGYSTYGVGVHEQGGTIYYTERFR